MPAPHTPRRAVPSIVVVDVARELPLLGMFSVYKFDVFDAAGSPATGPRARHRSFAPGTPNSP
jgi:hypothetical protein